MHDVLEKEVIRKPNFSDNSEYVCNIFVGL